MENVPVHVSIIMDGNGRWAKLRGKDRILGHYEGVESVRSVMEESVALGVKYLSLFAFSEENWERPKAEVSGLMQLMMKMMVRELENMLRNGIRFVVLGNRSRLPDELNAEIDRMMKLTASNDTLTLVLFVSYSGKWDISQASRRMAVEGGDDISRYLVTAEAGIPDPDVIIRTSGEKRLSNYMLWQAAYSEFVFVDTLWPDFRKEEYRFALEEYSRRDRRFGKVK